VPKGGRWNKDYVIAIAPRDGVAQLGLVTNQVLWDEDLVMLDSGLARRKRNAWSQRRSLLMIRAKNVCCCGTPLVPKDMFPKAAMFVLQNVPPNPETVVPFVGSK